MNPKPIELAENRDLPNAVIAMRRAFRRAREIAAQTDTYVVYMRDGKLVWEAPGPEFFPKPAPPKSG